jgi:hypothetical protein
MSTDVQPCPAIVRAPPQPLPGDGLAGPYVPRDCRTWVTGMVPASAIGIQTRLPAPTVHDTPSACKTYTDAPCTVKACQGHSERFRLTDLCTRCWARVKKVTRADEVPDA